MILKNSFYTILDKTISDELTSFHVSLDAGHPIFEGHFPGNPITPGVVQIEIVKELIEESISHDVELKAIGNSKFLNILNPIETPKVRVDLKVNQTDSLIKIDAVIKSEDQAFFKIKASYNLPATSK